MLAISVNWGVLACGVGHIKRISQFRACHWPVEIVVTDSLAAAEEHPVEVLVARPRRVPAKKRREQVSKKEGTSAQS